MGCPNATLGLILRIRRLPLAKARRGYKTALARHDRYELNPKKLTA
jgi:hypothetical protein